MVLLKFTSETYVILYRILKIELYAIFLLIDRGHVKKKITSISVISVLICLGTQGCVAYSILLRARSFSNTHTSRLQINIFLLVVAPVACSLLCRFVPCEQVRSATDVTNVQRSALSGIR